MKKCLLVFSLLAVILTWAMFACAPKAAPSVVPTSATQPSVQHPTPAASPTASAWDQVVAAAKKEGELTPYTFVFTGDFATVITRSFDQSYGIKISPVVGPGSTLSERIKSEQAAGKNIADTFDTAASTVAQAKLDGLTANIGPIPQLADVTKFRANPQLDPDGHFVGTYVITTTIYVNTNLVKPGDEPRSYKELLDPKWKGKIVEATPVSSASINRVYLALKKSGQADDSYWSSLAKQDLKVVATVRDAANILARGEASILPAGQSVTMTPLIIQGAPVKPVNIAEGIIVSVGTPLALVKNAPHPNAARVFINWVISPEGQKIYQDNLGVIPLNKDLPEAVPPGARLNLDKVISINLADELEVARIQRVGAVAQLLGVPR